MTYAIAKPRLPLLLSLVPFARGNAHMNEGEKQRNYELADKLISEQNFAVAVVAGAVATLLAAVAYGITVAIWAFSYGFAAAGVGIVIGLSMGFLGRGISKKFAVVAALIAITGCVLGNIFRVLMEQAQATETLPIDVLRNTLLSVLAERSVSNVSFVDLVYLLIAVICAVFVSKRPLSRKERFAIGLFELRG